MADRIERCCLCDEPTGRAGKHDDSIFISLPNCTLGPLCETCMHGLEEWCAENTGSAAELAAQIAEKEKYEAYIHTIRPKSDCYDRLCKSFGITHNIGGYVDALTKRAERNAEIVRNLLEVNIFSCPLCKASRQCQAMNQQWCNASSGEEMIAE